MGSGQMAATQPRFRQEPWHPFGQILAKQGMQAQGRLIPFRQAGLLDHAFLIEHLQQVQMRRLVS